MHRKHLYFPLLLLLLLLIGGGYWWLRPPMWSMLLLAAGWLALSWAVRRPYLLFFQGLNLLNRQEYAQAEALLLQFLEQLGRQPGLKAPNRLFLYGAFTADLEAMTLNNLGVAKMGQAEHAAAADYFHRALQVDERYAKPYFNLAVLAATDKDMPKAEQYFQAARERGYEGGSFDQFLQKIQTGYSKTYS
ncbi:MAG TPA: tetratricopeptide repeat protein [Saprospiraceae bacterium]|nr:tetratricopeptide repeat protein [Saprospiraceae bacterium]HND89973.1 tetratricopeptide repeat protein [Saprospiraceae bacterium]